MKRMNPEDVTENLSEEQLEILAEMASEDPVPKEWIECSKKLSDKQKFQVYEKRGELREREIASMTEEEKFAEEEKKKAFRKKLEDDPFYFFGNMSRPDTPEEFKSRFGVWPDGTDGETYNPQK